MKPYTHRYRMLSWGLLVILLGGFVAACGDTNTPVPAGITTQAASVTTVAAPPITQPQGELRIGTGLNIPANMDVNKGTTAYNMVTYGAGETLMRLTTQQKLEPWLAESITSSDPTTWQVKLRKGVKFHDGSPMNAQAVADSFKSSWTTLSGATNFISKDTQISVIDEHTLIFKTPQPAGDFPFNVGSWNFVIHKPGTPASIMTGMYKPIKLEKDLEFGLEAFMDHWAGPPPLKKVTVKVVVDVNARVLALQSGDLNMLVGVPPEVAKGLPAEIEKISVPGTRLHHILLNLTRPPFNEKPVREATALAIDREALNKATLDGQGAIATNIFPPNAGIEVVAAQRTDPARARQLLEEAGWKMGADGIREKEGKKLSFTLYSYPGRAELTQMSVAIQSQLKPLGYEVKVQEVRDIQAQFKAGFEAGMFSVNTSINGDPQYMFGTSLIKSGIYNYGGYSNPQVETLYDQLRGEGDIGKRQAISRQLQEIVKEDTPHIYLVAPPSITAFGKGTVKGYVPHPNDLYLIDRNIALSK